MCGRWRSAATPICALAGEALRAARAGRHAPRRMRSFRVSSSTRVYGIEANEFALHSRIAAQPELGVLPNLGYFVTVQSDRARLGLGRRCAASSIRAKRASARRRSTLSQTQRQLVSNLYSKYNETLTARAAADNLRRIADLASESLRLIDLRYEAGESTALEVVDAQNTLVQARNAADDAEARYRVALAELQTAHGTVLIMVRPTFGVDAGGGAARGLRRQEGRRRGARRHR